MANTDVNDTVGMNIRRLRKERGMTQGDLADKAGIQRESIRIRLLSRKKL